MMLKEKGLVMVAVLWAGLSCILACNSEHGADESGADADADTDVDADTDTDTDTDTDADTDADSDLDTETDENAIADYLESGFETVASGAFILGSPVTELCRGKYTEEQVDVTLTRSFEIAKTEVTQKIWASVGFPNPLGSNPEFEKLKGDDRPVTLVNWHEAMAFCNRLSDAAGLERCYDLSNCTGDAVGSGCPDVTWDYGRCKDGNFNCGTQVRKMDDMYECEGYRLPTSAEWEYAARAGTTTATYGGEVAHDYTEGCVEEPAVEPIAWYCANAQGLAQPVGKKEPNDWSLYDMLGNADEWVDYIYTGWGLAKNEGQDGPLTDPMGVRDEAADLRRSTMGGSAGDEGCLTRSAKHAGYDVLHRLRSAGFRPVRTLPAD